jgi:hypothetical protein
VNPLKLIFGRKGGKVAIAPFGGELRPAPLSPESAIRQMGVREFLVLLLLFIAITFTVLNIGLSLFAQYRAGSTVYVADGTPFGCEVEEIGQ